MSPAMRPRYLQAVREVRESTLPRLVLTGGRRCNRFVVGGQNSDNGDLLEERDAEQNCRPELGICLHADQ
jgi:hypothetical protein